MKQVFQFFKNLNIRSKLLGGYTLAFLLAVLAGGVIISVQVEKTIEAHIESELTNSTAAILNMVKTAAATSIKNHLRAVAEKNQDIIRSIYLEYRAGMITEEEAKSRARKILFSQTIGKTGYIFCADTKGTAIEHPNPGIAGRKFLDRPFVHQMLAMKEGYLEYDWQNPEDDQMKPKAMYMAYFEPWDWIIAVSSYREEFRELVRVEDFRSSVLNFKFGKSGYAYIFDTQGNLIVHPFMTGNFYDAQDEQGNYFVRKLCEMKSGKAAYTWKNPDEPRAREKLVIFNYLPEYDWIIAAAIYQDEIYAPLTLIKRVIMGIMAFICLLVFLVSFWIDRSVIQPLKTLMDRFDQGAAGNFDIRMPVTATDEIGQLAGYFNRFMDKLAVYSHDLKTEIAQRRENEKALRLSEQMFSKAFRSSPAGMFITSLDTGRIINVNDSFLTITRFQLMEIVGREMLSLLFFARPEQGRTLFEDIRKNFRVRNRELAFLTDAGERRMGLFSGEKLDLWGEVCILGAMEDITEARHLEQEILNASQKERENIALALHDDLGPQLIGIEVMTKMLQQRLDQDGVPGHAGAAARIRDLIVDAIDKTRSLSRGLSPVNLTDRGFDTSLEDLAQYITRVFHLACTLETDGLSDRSQPFSDNNVATHAYYIVHEAVHNAVKHAHCNSIRISLTRENGRVVLSITDNGSGMPQTAGARNTGPLPSGTRGMGIRIMSYRAGRINATLKFTPADPSGTRVILSLPAQAKAPVAAMGAAPDKEGADS